MIVRAVEDVQNTDREVHAPTWSSRRLLVREDGMGFSVHETVIHAGTETKMWYRNHLEAVYCMEGDGEIEDRATGERHNIRRGTLYALDKHDKHILRCFSDMRLLCVFSPACVGTETHDEQGGYPLLDDSHEGSMVRSPATR